MPNLVHIANLDTGDTAPQIFQVEVDYNLDAATGKIVLTCSGATPPPAHNVTSKSGTAKFEVEHASASANDTVTADYQVSSTSKAINIVEDVNFDDNPPIKIHGVDFPTSGLGEVDADETLEGTYNPNVGNQVILLVLKPRPGRRPKVVFANPAVTLLQADGTGRWFHPAIADVDAGGGTNPNVNGFHLVVLLTKNGVIQKQVRVKLKETLP
jgi:hypothetical protein